MSWTADIYGDTNGTDEEDPLKQAGDTIAGAAMSDPNERVKPKTVKVGEGFIAIDGENKSNRSTRRK